MSLIECILTIYFFFFRTGGGPQWVSEIYYGPKDTTGGNIGDSRCSMGRIAWFDAHARKIDGTNISLMQFNNNLLLLQNDLIENTWMHERYGCDGKQQMNRTMYYFVSILSERERASRIWEAL